MYNSANLVDEDLVTIDIFEVQSRQTFEPWPEMDKSIWTEDVCIYIVSKSVH